MLPAQYRMTRSTDFGATVRCGARSAQPDLVVHALRDVAGANGPKIGLIVAKSVGSAVQRHQVSRRLRHVAKTVLDDLGPADRIVIRALPSSGQVTSSRLEQELHSALIRLRFLTAKEG